LTGLVPPQRVLTHNTAHCRQDKPTDETHQVEEVLRKAGFEKVDAYRDNSASIRVRVNDSRFEGLPPKKKREAMIKPQLKQLPGRTQGDIVKLFTLAQSEFRQTLETLKEFPKNTEFDDPSPYPS